MSDLAFELPDFDIMPVNELLGLHSRSIVIGRLDNMRTNDMTGTIHDENALRDRPSNGLVLLQAELLLEQEQPLQHQAFLPPQLIMQKQKSLQVVVSRPQELLLLPTLTLFLRHQLLLSMVHDAGPGTVNLAATVPAGQTIEWFSAATGGTGLGTGATFTTPSIPTTTTYYAEAKVTAGGCVSASRTAVVANINTSPPAPTSPVDGSRCGPGTVNLSATVPAGQTIEWFSAAAGGTALGTGATFTTPSVSTTTTYYAEAKLTAGGCVSPSRTAVVANINPLPAAPTAPVDGSRCGPGTVNLSATVPAGQTIEWFSAATGGTALGTGATFTTPSIPTTTTYYAEAKVTAGGCVSASRTAVIANINTIPAAPTAPVDGSRCGPGTVNLSATVPAGQTIEWFSAATGELRLEREQLLQHQASPPPQLIMRKRR